MMAELTRLEKLMQEHLPEQQEVHDVMQASMRVLPPHAISTPDYPALVADALRRFPLGEYTEDQIVGKIMKARGGNADPIKLRHEIRRQAKD